MNIELKNFIESELKLNELPFSEKCGKVQEKIEELKNVIRELDSYCTEEELTLLQPVKEIEGKLKEKFQKLQISSDPTKDYYDIYVPFEISGIKFICTLSFIFNLNCCRYQSGIYSFEKRKTEITEFLKPLFDRKIIEDREDDWYGYQTFSKSDEALEHFTNLIKAVEVEKEKVG
jgi:hypothetical protein